MGQQGRMTLLGAPAALAARATPDASLMRVASWLVGLPQAAGLARLASGT